MLPVPITWSVKNESLVIAVYWSCRKMGYTVDRKHMNARGLTESLDDKIMGDIAAVAVLDYMQSLGIPVVAYDQIRIDNFQSERSGLGHCYRSKCREMACRNERP